MRYQFYREHKYVSEALNDVERLIARTDFRDGKEIAQVSRAFDALARMLHHHAEYENERLHSLLAQKQSTVHTHIEEDHIHQEAQIAEIKSLIEQVGKISSEEEQIGLGYRLYLTYRKFVADNLAHLHEEETKILPELQRLYTDDELRQVEAKTYRQMTPEQMVHMMSVLFPCMNPTDREAFLEDINLLEPEKFAIVWELVRKDLPENERESFERTKKTQA